MGGVYVPYILVSLEWMQGCWCLNPYNFVFYRWYICCNGFCSDWRIFKVGRQDKTNTNAWPPNVWNKYFASPQPLHPHDRTHIYTQVNTAVCVQTSYSNGNNMLPTKPNPMPMPGTTSSQSSSPAANTRPQDHCRRCRPLPIAHWYSLLLFFTLPTIEREKLFKHTNVCFHLLVLPLGDLYFWVLLLLLLVLLLFARILYCNILP